MEDEKTLRATFYARVSTTDQHCAMQESDLTQQIARHGWTPVEPYIEKASGKAGAVRPAQQRLMKDAADGKFDIVLVWRLDRFGRSLAELIQNILILDSHGVRFLCSAQQIDTNQKSPFARLLLHILASFSEFERAMIRERVTAGLVEYRKAYEKGKVGLDRVSRSGKNLPAHRPHRIFRRDQVAVLRAEGVSWRKIAAQLGVPLSTVRRASL
jgi:putative DNA-invertase from lambdoid prophage Rac